MKDIISNLPQRDPEWLMTAASYHHLAHALRSMLPLPVNNSAPDLARRDTAAIAKVAAVHPVNAMEAEYAAEIVAAKAHMADCLRLAVLAGADTSEAMRCRTHADCLSRQADRAMRILQRLQAERRAREATQALADNDAWVATGVIQLMSDGLRGAGEVAPQRPPGPSAAPAPPSEALLPEPLVADALAEAEELAIVNPSWAALIRRHGSVPADLRRDAPAADVVEALVAGRSPALMALDRMKAG